VAQLFSLGSVRTMRDEKEKGSVPSIVVLTLIRSQSIARFFLAMKEMWPAPKLRPLS